jgi:hypothetical protein
MMEAIVLTYQQRLLLAILIYLGLYVLAANLAWACRTPRAGRVGRAIEFVRLWGRKLLLGDVLRMGYYLGVPYLLLLWGWVSPLDLGLADLDWVRGTGQAVALAVGSLTLLALIWMQYARLARSDQLMRQERWLAQPWGWAFVLREAILLESGWAACRSPMLMLAGPYLGVYLGLAAVFMAGLLNARTRYELIKPGLREEVVLTASLAVVTATLYVFVHNLWLCILVHFLLRVALLRLIQSGARHTALAH